MLGRWSPAAPAAPWGAWAQTLALHSVVRGCQSSPASARAPRPSQFPVSHRDRSFRTKSSRSAVEPPGKRSRLPRAPDGGGGGPGSQRRVAVAGRARPQAQAGEVRGVCGRRARGGVGRGVLIQPARPRALRGDPGSRRWRGAPRGAGRRLGPLPARGPSAPLLPSSGRRERGQRRACAVSRAPPPTPGARATGPWEAAPTPVTPCARPRCSRSAPGPLCAPGPASAGHRARRSGRSPAGEPGGRSSSGGARSRGRKMAAAAGRGAPR